MRAQTVARRTFVQFLTRGEGDSEDQQVTDRNPHQELIYPELCFGFVFYDQDFVVIERDPEDGEGPTEATSDAYNISGKHYRVARKLAKDGSPHDRMVTAVVAQMFERMGQPEPEMVEVYDPDSDRPIVMVQLMKDDVIVREPHPDAGKRKSRRGSNGRNCDDCHMRGQCPIEDLVHTEGGCGEHDSGGLFGSLLRAMSSGRRRERPEPEAKPEADAKQEPSATPAE